MSLFALSLLGCGGLDFYGSAHPERVVDAVQGRQRDPIREILERVEPLPDALATDKFCRMSAGPFPFYRATAHLFYDDLFDAPEREAFAGPVTWLSGDAHPQNLGAFDDDEGQVVYDLNDFDESFIGDAQFDLWRLAAGVDLLADEVDLDDDHERVIEAVLDGYVDAVFDHADGDSEQDFRLTEHTAWGRLDDFLDDVEDDNSRRAMLRDWTDHGRFDLERSGIQPIEAELEDALRVAWPGYVASLDTGLAGETDWFAIKDVERRVGAGLGSFGTPRVYVLVEGPSDDDDDDRLLDVKLQGEPAVWPHLDDAARLFASEPGLRVVSANAALLNEADDHLGSVSFAGGSWSVRERSPYKETLDNAWIDSRRRFRRVAEQWGYALATAHARADEDAHRGVEGDWDAEMARLLEADEAAFRRIATEVARGYAEVVRADHRLFEAQVGCR